MTMMLLFAAAAALASGGALDDAWICARTDRNPLFYNVGDEVVFTLEARGVRGALPDGYTLKWTRTGDDGVRKEGSVPFTAAPFVYRTRIGKAGFVRLYAEVCGPDGKAYRKQKTFDLSNPEGREAANRFERQPKNLFFDGGAGAAIDTLQSLPEPADFDAFWTKRRKRLEDLPMIADLKSVVSNANGVTYAVSVNCAGMMPSTFHMSVPAKCASGAKVPAVVRFWGYSGNRKPAAFAPHANIISVDFNPHGFELGREDEYYREFYRATASGRATVDQSPEPVWPVSYGMDIDKNSQAEFAYFGGITWRLMRCLQYVKTRPEWDGQNLKAVGGSQGGLQTIWAAALDPDVNEADSSITWCCDMGGETLGRNRGSWYVHWTKALGYYDPVNLAKRIPRTCAVTISRAGLGDYVCPPSGLAILWNNLRCPKKIVWVQGSQHGYVPPEAYDGRDIVCEK